MFDQLRHLKTLSLGLDASTLGGTAGTLQQLSTGGSLSGLDANADHAVRIAQQALAYVSNVESLLERARRSGRQNTCEIADDQPVRRHTHGAIRQRINQGHTRCPVPWLVT